MGAPLGPGLPDSQISLFEHAARLHAEHPDGPLPRDGEPYPDADSHRGDRPRAPRDYRTAGIDAAAVLDEYFSRDGGQPDELEFAFHDVFVPVHHNEHITAAAWRAGAERVQETGRWLARHSRDRCSVTIGLALLAAGIEDDDIPVIQTIGLLSDKFSPLAAHALGRHRNGTEALLWLGGRVAWWGRVYLAETICHHASLPRASAWLLRKACSGDFLDGYFAGKVATAAHLHEAITANVPDGELLDHTSLVLVAMTRSDGIGITLADYPPAPAVMEAHAAYAQLQAPTSERFFRLGTLLRYLASSKADKLTWGIVQREDIRGMYVSLLNRDDWCAVARKGLAKGNPGISWLAGVPGLYLRAFASDQAEEG